MLLTTRSLARLALKLAELAGQLVIALGPGRRDLLHEALCVSAGTAVRRRSAGLVRLWVGEARNAQTSRTGPASTAAAAAAHRPAASARPARCGSCRGEHRCGDGSRAARDPLHASTAGS